MTGPTRFGLLGLLLAAMLHSRSGAETVILRDGRRLVGHVEALDSANLRLKTAEGPVHTIPRNQLQAIHFDEPAPALRVEVRAVAGDDELDLLLNEEPVLEGVSLLGCGWVDVTDRLIAGNNALRVRVRNQRTSWAYRWELRVNGAPKVFACGQPGVKSKGCTCCGYRGTESGTIEGIDPVWLHVDRAAGTAEIVGR